MDIWSGDNNQNSTGTLVAVIDDGLRYTHAEFSGHLWNGSSCYDYQNIFTGGCMYGFDTFDIDKDPISH
jgi:subtilisin family serine protease